nr:hypothetical protein Itr_chr02CG17900 [Ipomoea trifida]
MRSRRTQLRRLHSVPPSRGECAPVVHNAAVYTRCRRLDSSICAVIGPSSPPTSSPRKTPHKSEQRNRFKKPCLEPISLFRLVRREMRSMGRLVFLQPKRYFIPGGLNRQTNNSTVEV